MGAGGRVEVLRVTSDADRRDAFDVRERVFVVEQGVPVEMEWDEEDAAADHFLARVGGKPRGVGRLVVGGGGDTGVLGRLAVLPEARGAGLGAALVGVIERRAAERGLAAIELHAQTHALGFYRRLGYQPFGEEFMEAGIPHLSMRKSLGAAG